MSSDKQRTFASRNVFVYEMNPFLRTMKQVTQFSREGIVPKKYLPNIMRYKHSPKHKL